uniref:RanBD1 domain-containing protein n=1 Tax=Caenorhabditis tropicalis TaxID=1561998 RepID=A0A1I7UIB0_9PELO
MSSSSSPPAAKKARKEEEEPEEEEELPEEEEAEPEETDEGADLRPEKPKLEKIIGIHQDEKKVKHFLCKFQDGTIDSRTNQQMIRW